MLPRTGSTRNSPAPAADCAPSGATGAERGQSERRGGGDDRVSRCHQNAVPPTARLSPRDHSPGWTVFWNSGYIVAGPPVGPSAGSP